MPTLPSILFLSILLLFPGTALLGQEGPQDGIDVDRQELRSQAESSVEFENFEGPQDDVDTAEEIRGIGRSLFGALEPEPGGVASYFDRYTIFRGVDREDPEGLDADVLSINENAQVNHIDNVRRILAGYLQDAFGYSDEDASLVAELTTVYNAVYRGNMEFFSARYKDIVVDYLDPSRAGIATRYDEWPGATQLVIPLSTGAEPGDLDAVSPLQISDPGVIEDLRRRREMGIETRKEMIAFIERVIEERQEAIEEERAAVEEEREQIEEERQAIQEEREEIAADEAPEDAPVEDSEDAPAEAPEDAPVQDGEEAPPEVVAEEEQPPVTEEAPVEEAPVEEAPAEEQSASEERLTELQEEEEALEEREQELQEREEELAEEEEEVEELTERAQELYEETSEDQEQVIEEQGRQEEAAAAEPVLFFLVRESGDTGQLVQVDRRTGEILSRRQGTPLRRGSFRSFQDAVVAIEASEGEEARALLLDEESLSETVAADSSVYGRSSLLVGDGVIYMVVPGEGDWRIGRFSPELELQASSVAAVNPDSYLLLAEGTVLAQAVDGNVLVLDEESLRVTR